MNFEAISVIPAIVATVIAAVSLIVSWRMWVLTQRPVVSAFIKDVHHSGGMSEFYLFVCNTGNQPATEVRLRIGVDQLRKIVDFGGPDELVDCARGCFSDEAKIPLLRNGEEMKTFFGRAGDPNGSEKSSLHYGETAEILIEYRGLDGRNWKSKLSIKVYVRHGFGGSTLQINGKEI